MESVSVYRLNIMSVRENILQEGLLLFSKRGYLGATTKEIAREAAVAELNLFRNFTSKKKLFEEVINTYSFLSELKGLLPEIEDMPYEKSLTAIAKTPLKTLSSRKDLIQIMLSEIPRYPGKIRNIDHALKDEIIRTLASYFYQMQRKGLLINSDLKYWTRAFLGIFFSCFLFQKSNMRKKHRDDDAEKTIKKEYVKLFVRGTLRSSQFYVSTGAFF